MDRRKFLGFSLAIPAASFADCRDERGMIMPEESKELLEITLRDPSTITPWVTLARAVFGFGAYEDLLAHQKAKEKYNFHIDGRKVAIQVTRLDVDVNRRIGCVVCEVHGRLYQ